LGQLGVTAVVPGLDADFVYERVCAFEEYPSYSEAVREVEVIEKEASSITSSWEVKFRRGILCWTERATLHADAGLITFEEVDGDVDEFAGSWSVESTDDGVRVQFVVTFDIGVPTLEHILDPIAEEALCDNVVSILRGLLGDGLQIVSVTSTSGHGVPGR
jgi:ribosome-associated toxin RatA of RatAB toxin-antitoxin module